MTERDMADGVMVVVPWVTPAEVEAFLQAWHVPSPLPSWLILQQDSQREGCGRTKNRGIQAALPYVDDFLPLHNLASLEHLAAQLGSLRIR